MNRLWLAYTPLESLEPHGESLEHRESLEPPDESLEPHGESLHGRRVERTGRAVTRAPGPRQTGQTVTNPPRFTWGKFRLLTAIFNS